MEQSFIFKIKDVVIRERDGINLCSFEDGNIFCIRSKVNNRRSIGIVMCRGVRGCVASASSAFRLFITLGFRPSSARAEAVTSERFSNARA